MKRILQFWFTAILLLHLASTHSFAQLSAGDIAFVGYNADGNDGFAFIALNKIPAGTVIHFQDNEWNGSAIGSGGAFNTGEGSTTWTNGGSDITPGTVVELLNTSNSGSRAVNIGTLSGGTLSFSGSGESIFAFLGTNATTPSSFLAAITSNNGGFSGATTSGLLTGTDLTAGSTALVLPGTGGADVAAYNPTAGGSSFASKGTALSAFNNPSNWVAQDASGDQDADATSPDAPFLTDDQSPLKSITFSIGVNLSVNFSSGTEAAQTVITVKATASAAVTGDQTLSLAVTGTGITAGDYNLSIATITIMGGQTMGSVTFTILDDTDVEGLETATLTISSPSAGITLGATTTQDITITDNDSAPSTTIDLSTYVRIGRYNLPVPLRATAPMGNQLALEVSAVTYNPVNGNLYVLGDEGTSIVEVGKNGQLISTMTLTTGDFLDPEGLTHFSGSQFVLVEERERQANLFTYVAGGTLSRANVQSVKLGTTIGNIGLEGISYDPQTGGYILVKEITPQGIFQTGIDFGAGTATNGSPSTVNSTNLFDPALAGLTDIGDVYALSNLPTPLTDDNLLVLSQEDGKVINIDRTGSIANFLSITTDPGNPLNVAEQGHEGVAMDNAGLLYIVNEQGGGDGNHPQLWVYAPATYVYSNAAPVEVSVANPPASLPENTSTASRVKVGNIIVSDDALGTNVLSLTGADAAAFEIVGNELFLKAGTVLDFETKPSYSVTINVDDASVGVSPDASRAFTLTISDVFDNPSPLCITEVAPWSSGNSPGVLADWFEVTNTSAAAVDITGWKIDDDSGSFANASALSGVTSIAAGQSVIFVDGDATKITAFINVWFGGTLPSGVLIGNYGGPGLGAGGDAVNLFDASGNLIIGVTFGASPSASPFATFDNTACDPAVSTLSEEGANGAYDVVDGTVTLIGSPGSIECAAPTATISGGGSVCSPATTATVTITGTPKAIVVLSDNTMVTIEGDGSTDVSLGAGTYTISSVTSAAPVSCPGTGSGTAMVTIQAPTPSPVFADDANCTTPNGDVCVGTKLSFSVDANASSNLPNGSVIEWVLDANNNGDVYDEANSAVLATQTVTKNTVTLPSGSPVINEILFNATTETGTTNGEGWEIAGTPGTDISCFYFTDGDFVVQIPNNTVIPADGFYVVGGNAADNSWSAARDLSLGAVSGLGSLTNGGEYLALFNASNTFVNGVIWGSPSAPNSPGGATAISNAALIVAGSGCPALPSASTIASSIVSEASNFTSVGAVSTTDEQSIERSTDVTGTWQVNAAPGNTPNSLGFSNQGANTIPYTFSPACAEYTVLAGDCNTTLRIRPRISPVTTTCFTGNNQPTLAEKTYTVICPTASVVAASNEPVCEGADAVFNITGPANGKVTYTLGNGSVAVDLDAQGVATVTTSTANGNVTLTLEKVELSGCTTTLKGNTATVTTKICCNAVLATTDSEICVGESTNLTITVSNGSGNYTISIDDGDLNTLLLTNSNYSNGTPISVSPTVNTTYTLVSVMDNGLSAEVCSKTGSPTITVSPLPNAPAIPNFGACVGESTRIVPPFTAGSAITATYDFENTSARRAGVAGGAGAGNITVSDMAVGPGLNQTGNIFGGTAPTETSAFATDQWTTNTSMDPNDYLEFCIAANAGYVLDLSSFRFDAQRSGSGVMKYMLALSLNGGSFSTIGSEGDLPTSFAAFSQSLETAVIGAETVCIRIYGYNSGATGGNLRIDNVVFSGTVRPNTQYNFYDVDPTNNLSQPIATGSSYDPAPSVGTSKDIWVTCLNDQGCESLPTKVTVTLADCKYEISDPCTCAKAPAIIENGTTSNDGTFSENITVNAPTGQSWTVKPSGNLNLYSDDAATMLIPDNTPLVETPAGSGFYIIKGYHKDGVGYSLTVTNGRGTDLSISNLCNYPDPQFAGLPKLVVPNAAPFTVTGQELNGASGSGTFVLGTTPITLNMPPPPHQITIDPAGLAPGSTHTLNFTFTANDPAKKIFCAKTVSQQFQIAQCGCQDLFVSLNDNCKFELTADLISDGNCANGTVRVMDNDPSNGNLIDCAGVWTYGLFDSFGNVICWGKVTAEDKTAPIFVCADWFKGTLDCYDVDFVLNNRLTIGNVDATSSPRPSNSSPQTFNNAEGVAGTGACNLVPPSLVADNINNLGYTYFKDNCYNCGCRTTVKWSDRVVFYNCEQMKENGGIYARIYRTWVATDCKGMSRDTVQEIPFARPAIEDFAFNGDGDGGKYDQVVEYGSCVPDKELIQKSDYLPLVCSYFNRKTTPRLSRCFYLDEVECNYSVSFKDTEFPICGGKGVKIDREVYVFDWCAGRIVDTFHVLIKFGDFSAPSLEYAPQAPFNISTGPMDCTAAFPISATGIKSTFGVDIKDNCALGNVSVSVYTKDRYVKGILVYEGDANPFCGGTFPEDGVHPYGILAEDQSFQKDDICWDKVEYAVMNGMMIGLPVGKHLMVIDAFDGCYNASTAYFVFEVKDKIAPVMKCDDDLHITLSNANGYTNGYAQVSAADIDEGSWDNCKMAWIAV
ncbi:MAG: SdiA-regulated domain-containing protein, partial [Haliscomenobacter sp.]|uniref:SdiA-regulated domain-containing protein n=1 Tax=Haliscomenobacter sp. TaxID=2717303 RepID=UPI0029BE0024